jgi:AraC-like DNA-binding protein
MNHLHFSTLAESAVDRSDCWGRINRIYFGDLGVECLDAGPFDAELSAYDVGPLRLFRIDAPAHRVWRDAVVRELPTDGYYKLVLQLAGRAQIRHRDCVFDLHPGDWSLYDPRAPYSITNFERAELLVAQVPRQQLKGFKVPNLHTSAAQSSGLLGLSAVFGSFLRSLSEQLPMLPNAVGPAVSETAFGLLASTLAACQDASPDPAPLPAVLKLRVKQHVQTHLGEADLTIERIALDLRCSKRYLHRVFEDEPVSLERYIWLARLERCRAALESPDAARRSVSEIAFAWGFNSSAHFCRLFKSHYGVSPSEFRRRATAAQGSAAALSH